MAATPTDLEDLSARLGRRRRLWYRLLYLIGGRSDDELAALIHAFEDPCPTSSPPQP